MVVQQLKELEKLGPKMKGIGEIAIIFLSCHRTRPFSPHTTRLFFPVSQSVKEVLQSLVDDNLVQMDKIGSSNCTVSHRPNRQSSSYTRLFCIRTRLRPPHIHSLLELPFSERRDRECEPVIFIAFIGR
jgi:hypothetical protein